MTQAQAPVPGSDKQAAPTPPKGKSNGSKASKGSEGGEKKARAPRKDYGYSPTSIIHIVQPEEGKEPKFHGKRKQYFDLLVKFDGKTINDFEGEWPDKNDPPRGWVRFFVQNGNATLERVKPADEEKAKK